MEKDNILISTLAGSKSYGTDTKESDTDIRGVYKANLRSEIFGLDQIENKRTDDSEDSMFWELVHFFKMLMRGNSQSLEILYSDNSNILSVNPDFSELVLKNRERFVDTEVFLKSLYGYIEGEKNRCFKYHGIHGDKRKKAIDEYGYSYKNAVQVLRLSQCGIWFLKDGYFSVNVMKRDIDFGRDLLEIKTNPQDFSKEEIFRRIQEKESELKETEKNRDKSVDKKFDLEYSLDVIQFFRLKTLGLNIC